MRDWVADHRGERYEHSAVGADEADGTPDQNSLEAKLEDPKIEEQDR